MAAVPGSTSPLRALPCDTVSLREHGRLFTRLHVGSGDRLPRKWLCDHCWMSRGSPGRSSWIVTLRAKAVHIYLCLNICVKGKQMKWQDLCLERPRTGLGPRPLAARQAFLSRRGLAVQRLSFLDSALCRGAWHSTAQVSAFQFLPVGRSQGRRWRETARPGKRG